MISDTEPRVVVSKCRRMGGYLISVESKRFTESDRMAGNSPEEAAAALARAIVRYGIRKGRAIAPADVMALIKDFW